MAASQDALSLLELASRCRRLADGAWDEATKAIIRALIAKYEAAAFALLPTPKVIGRRATGSKTGCSRDV